jgi:hypothetical protein
MANTQISDLPLYTGDTNDGFIVWNDTGETTTYKTKYYSLLKPGTGVDSAVSNNLPASHAPGDLMLVWGDHSSASSGNYSTVLGGFNNRTDSLYGAVVGGQNNVSGFRCFVGGGFGNSANGNASVVFGENCIAGNASQAFVVGTGCKVYGGNDLGFIAMGGSNVSSSNGARGIFSIGGYENRVSNFNGPGDAGRFVYGGILGGHLNYIGENRANADNATVGVNAYPLILGGYFNTLLGSSSEQNYFVSILNSELSTIQGGTTGGTIINSSTSVIDEGVKNTIIGSTGVYLSGITNSHFIGVENYTGDTTNTSDDTTYTNHHSALGQSYQSYYDNLSGSTFTIDWNNGNTQKMTWTASGGSITCSNTQTGAHYRMIIDNPSGLAPSSFVVSGRTVKFNGGSFVPYSGESICELFITNDSVYVNQLGLFS